MRQKNKSFDIRFDRKKLARIIEDPLEGLEDNFGGSLKRQTKIVLPKLKPYPLEALNFYETWLYSLSQFPGIYKYFKHKALKSGVLDNTKKFSLSPESSWTGIDKNLSDRSKFSIEKIDSQESLIPSQRMSILSKDSKLINLKSPLINNSTFSSALKAPAYQKILTIDKSNFDYLERFKDITGTSGNVTRENLRDFMNKRYNPEVTECLIKWIYQGMSANPENWVQYIQKFVSLPDEKHFKLAFDFYDHNKDKFICNSDAFYAISVDNNRNFTQDIVAISQKLEEKLGAEYKPLAAVKVSAAHKLRSIFEEKKRGPAKEVYRQDSLNFEEFCAIRFLYSKPEIVVDVVEYVSGIEIEEIEVRVKPKTRRNSEEIVKDMAENYKFKEELKTDPEYKYYLELFEKMNFFKIDKAKILLEKFNKMICPSYVDLKFLSKSSINEHWGNFFGVHNKFVNLSFYQFLAGYENRNISKTSFLQRLRILFDEEQENFFAFCVYDRDQDGLITCGEVNDLLQTLPETSFVYKECLMYELSRLANEFIASIFGKRLKPVMHIDFDKFQELIPKSIFLQVFNRKEFKESLLNREENRKNLSFCDSKELSQEQIERFLQYSHLSKRIELGVVASDDMPNT